MKTTSRSSLVPTLQAISVLLVFLGAAPLARGQQLTDDVEMISFDDGGQILPASKQRVDAIIAGFAGSPPTDVFIAAHGWNNSFGEARSSYRTMSRLMRTAAEKHQLLPADYRALVIGVSWPSKAWDEESLDRDAETSEGSEGDVLALYRVFPPSRSRGTYEQDILTMQQLLAASPDELTEADYRTVDGLFKKYRLEEPGADDDAVFSPATDQDALFESRLSIRNALRVFTYWQMKERAGIVGRGGVRRELVDRIQREFPAARVHLVGHSFGCKLMLACVGEVTDPLRKISSLILLQGAVSYQALNPDAGYANVPARVQGRILTTFSVHDQALGLPYELASRVARQTAELDVSRYSALGRVGAQRGVRVNVLPDAPGESYHLPAGLISADGQDQIFGHSDLYNAAVARLIWAAVLPAADADEELAEICDCADQVDAEIVDLGEEALPPIAERDLKSAKAKLAVDADAAELLVFFGNLHSHTKYSDGTGLPNEAYDHARNVAHLDFLMLSEHNHTSNMSDNGFRIGHNHERYEGPGADSLIAVATAKTVDGQFVALYGQEFSSISQGNHMNVFDVPKVIDDDDVPNGRFDLFLNTWLPGHHDSFGELGILQLNHPWTGSSPNNREYGRDDYDDFEVWREKLDGPASLIEVINGPSHSSGTGLDPATVSATEFRRYLKMGFHLSPTANQDNHKRTWGSITDARTGVLAPSLTKQNVLEALRLGRTYASLDKNLRLSAKVQGKVMGSTVTSAIADGAQLDVEVTFQDDDEAENTYWIEVFADNVEGAGADTGTNLVATYGPIQVTNNSATPATFTLPDLPYNGWDYLYLKIDEGPAAHPVDQAYLAPVWFEQ